MISNASSIAIAIVITIAAADGGVSEPGVRGGTHSLAHFSHAVTNPFAQSSRDSEAGPGTEGTSQLDLPRSLSLAASQDSTSQASSAQATDSYYNILAAGCVADGTSDNTSALAKAIAVAKSAGQGIYVPVGAFQTNNITITVPVMFAPGASVIKPATGQTVVLSGPVTADLSQHFANAVGGQGTVSFAANSPLKEVYPQWWGAKGDDSHDDTAAIQAAIVAYPKAVTLPPATYFLTGTIAIIHDFTNLRGAGIYTSILHFEPATEKPCLDIKSTGRDLISYVNLRDFGLLSMNNVKKAAIRITDGTEIFLENIKINGFTSATSDSIGLQLRGRELQTFRNMTITADIPISVEDDPNTIYDFDHYHFDNLYLVAAVTQPCVNVASGVNVSNITFDGYQSWIRGRYGFYYNDSATSNTSFALTIKNVRWEQNADDSGYMIYIAHHVNLNGLILENLYGGGQHGKGLYFRKVQTATITNFQYEGALEVLNADSSDKNFHFINPAWGNGTFTLAGFTYYNATAIAGSNFRTVNVANNAAGPLVPAAGDGAMTRGLVMVIAGGGAVGLFSVTGANHIVQVISDVAGAFSNNPGTPQKTNVYWSARNNRYEIQNSQGTGFVYSIYAWLDPENR